MKGIAAVDAAYKSVEFAMNGIHIADVHGINGKTPEETMRNMGADRLAGNDRDREDYCGDFLRKSGCHSLGFLL